MGGLCIIWATMRAMHIDGLGPLTERGELFEYESVNKGGV